VSVSQFEILCDFPGCSRRLSHGEVRPPLSVAEFRQGAGMLLQAHRWMTDGIGRDLCPYHSPCDDDSQIQKGVHSPRSFNTRQLMPLVVR
jgi:hypothetical protein